jgi:anti-anti-sigma factor
VPPEGTACAAAPVDYASTWGIDEMRGNQMTESEAVFQVTETSEGTMLTFPNWQNACAKHGATEIVIKAEEQLKQLINERKCRMLTINLQSIDFMPSVYLGFLILLYKRGMVIELMHVSESVRKTLETCNLDQMFNIKEGLA